ncbi:hypothetical protein Rs2_37935 [Raphanus sativus]|nr:hypothetical protein Rs2_37935 [Raphanus sativus]
MIKLAAVKNLIEKCDGKCDNKDDAKGKYISKRMTLLQDMVPGCNRITGKAVMLDKIIEYVSETSRVLFYEAGYYKSQGGLAQSKDFRHDTIFLPRTCLDSQTHNSPRVMDLFKPRHTDPEKKKICKALLRWLLEMSSNRATTTVVREDLQPNSPIRNVIQWAKRRE